MAQITEIEYGFSKRLDNLEAVQLAARFRLMGDSTPDDELDACRQWVHDRLPATEREMNESSQLLKQLHAERRRLEQQIETLRADYRKLQEKLTQLGMLPEDPDDLPF